MSDRRALALVCLFAFLGFGHESVMAGVLPLVVLERGGDAAVVGLLVAAYGIPTIALRPFVGRMLDGPRRRVVIQAGGAVIGTAPLGFLIPTLPSMVVSRVVQGAGWAAFGTSGHAVLAQVAPAGRRSEAAGYYNAMPSLAILIGPATGLWLYADVWDGAPFVLAAALGLAGLGVATYLASRRTWVSGDRTITVPVRLVVGMFDPVAVVPMVLIGTFMSVQSLFVIFAPVYARAHGIPLDQLGLYYTGYGVLMLTAHLLLGRVSDSVGRWRAIAAGCMTAMVGLALTATSPGLPGLLAGGGMFGIATALVTSSVSALTMESAPPDRTGSAMATYSVGYQLGASIGGAAWGSLIAIFGFPWPFVGGVIMVGLSLLVAALRLRTAVPRPVT